MQSIFGFYSAARANKAVNFLSDFDGTGGRTFFHIERLPAVPLLDGVEKEVFVVRYDEEAAAHRNALISDEDDAPYLTFLEIRTACRVWNQLVKE